jgi:hypothetical protein
MIKLYPSAELHLLRGQSVELELFMNHLGSNAWIRVNNPLALAPGVALATLSGRLLTASASAMGTNIDFLAIQDGQGNDILKVPVHVSVHDTVLRVMCSHARHEVEVTSSDRVLVVYAEFVDANGSVVVAEVTGSNLLHYDWSPADGLTVSADGRVEVSATPGTWTVTVTVDPAFGVTPTPTSASVIIHSVPAASEYPIPRDESQPIDSPCQGDSLSNRVAESPAGSSPKAPRPDRPGVTPGGPGGRGGGRGQVARQRMVVRAGPQARARSASSRPRSQVAARLAGAGTYQRGRTRAPAGYCWRISTPAGCASPRRRAAACL